MKDMNAPQSSQSIVGQASCLSDRRPHPSPLPSGEGAVRRRFSRSLSLWEGVRVRVIFARSQAPAWEREEKPK